MKYFAERGARSHERIIRSDEPLLRSMERVTYSAERIARSHARMSRSGEPIPRSTERMAYSAERVARSHEEMKKIILYEFLRVASLSQPYWFCNNRLFGAAYYLQLWV